METTKFHSLTIIHPHSGKVSRSKVATLIKHRAKGYNSTDKENADYLSQYGENVVILKDENGKISIDRVYRHMSDV